MTTEQEQVERLVNIVGVLSERLLVQSSQLLTAQRMINDLCDIQTNLFEMNVALHDRLCHLEARKIQLYLDAGLEPHVEYDSKDYMDMPSNVEELLSVYREMKADEEEE